MRMIGLMAALLGGGYLAGSIPFGWLIGKWRGVDIREHGSKNIGATNCGRVCGWPWGVLAFLLDVAKGFGPVFLANLAVPHLCGPEGQETIRWALITATAVTPILGHVLPVWLNFKGGKAVASSLGVLLAMPMLWWVALIALGVWGLVVAATAYVSVGSTVAALTFAAVYACAYPEKALATYLPVTVFVGLIVVLVLVKHRSNYARLLKGTENRVWGRRKGAEQAPGASGDEGGPTGPVSG